MQQQAYKNHVRYHPLFHYIGLPLVLINLIGSIISLVSGFSGRSALMVTFALGLMVTFASLRAYATKLQDRVIRMEENFRHYLLTGVPLDGRLATSQIIALRFASDEEFPALCHRAIEENLKMDAIKQAIQSWRADGLRV